MKYIQTCFAWMTTFSLIIGPVGLEGCSSKEKQPATIAQQDPPAQAQPGAPGTSSTQQASQQQSANQSQPISLPEVNLTPAGLDELLAPIALYPDPVLAVMLQASVDPQQVMDGGNWLALDQNNTLKEAALDLASKQAGFTPVMQALLHYPTVIDLMCTQFDWTKQLGAAYQADPKTVLDSVQRLRATAVDNGALKSGPQMKVDVTQQNGQQVVQLEPTNPKVVYVPQYDPQQVFSQTTTTTAPDGTTTTTTTTRGPAGTPAPATSSSSTVVVQQEKSGVSTGTAVLIGLLSFGAGMAVGAAINNNNYYYPSWGYGGVYYGGRPYYPPPYYPHYHGGWGPSYGYNRPVHYGNTNIYVNNSNNYYNRFNNNTNLNNNYKPMPVHYNNKPNGVYQNSVGNRPGADKGVNYNKQNPNYKAPQQRPANTGNNSNAQQRPGNAGNTAQQRPGNDGSPAQQRPAGNAGSNPSNWKGQTTYQGNKAGGANAGNRPATGNAQARPGGAANPGVNTGAVGRPGGASQGSGNANFGNKPVDRGYGQSTADGRQNAGKTSPSTRPSTASPPANRPSTQPASRPTQQPAGRPQSGGGAFGGVSSGDSNASSNRGRSSMGAPQHSAAKPAASKQAAPKKGNRP